MSEILEQKKLLRQRMLQLRGSLSPLQVMEMSQQVVNKLNELEPLRRARTIMGFSAIKNEVNLEGLFEQQLLQGKKILLPRVENRNDIAAVEFKGWEQCCHSQFGIREPLGEQFPEERIDVVLVPGLVFDGKGYRLGYGRGYYDRFLAKLGEKVFKCGICYNFQVVDDVFPHQNDIPLHWIVTDKSELLIDGDYF